MADDSGDAGNDANGCKIVDGEIKGTVDPDGNITGELSGKIDEKCAITGPITGTVTGTVVSAATRNIDIEEQNAFGKEDEIKSLRFVYAKFLSHGELIVDTLNIDTPNYQEFKSEAFSAYRILRFRNSWFGVLVRRLVSIFDFVLPFNLVGYTWFAPPSQFDLSFNAPTRIVFCLDSKYAQLGGNEGFRFVSQKKLSAGPPPEYSEEFNDTFNHRELFTIGRKNRKAVTVVNLYMKPKKKPKQRIYAFELDVDAKHTSISNPPQEYSTRVIIDPGVGNDGG